MAHARFKEKPSWPQVQRCFQSHWLSALFGRRVATRVVQLILILAAVGAPIILRGGVLSSSGPPPAPSSTAQSSSGAPVGLEVGEMAPDFSFTRLSGKSVSLSGFRGQPVILTFWYAASPVCLGQALDLQMFYRAQQRAGKDVVILSVNVADEAHIVQQVVQRFGLTYLVGLDDHRRVATLYHVEGIPTSYFINRQGVIRSVVVGPVDDAALQQQVAQVSQ